METVIKTAPRRAGVMDEGWIRQVEHAIDTFEEDDRLIELKVHLGIQFINDN